MIRVIIADDEINVCRLIRGLIDWESLDMEIVGTAHNGVEALEMIQSLNPDLMITDIRMPGYDGLEMIRRAKDIKRDLDFIIISGYRHFEYAQNAIKYGVSDYLLKPINKEDFMVSLNKMHDRYLRRTERMSREEQLKKQLQSDADKLRAGLFTELLNRGADTSGLTLETVNETYRYHFQPGLFQVCAVKIDCGFDDQYQKAIPILGDKAARIFDSLLRGDCFDMGLFLQDSTACCLLNYDGERKKQLRRHLKAVLDELMMQKAAFEQFEFTLGAGAACGDVGGLKNAFQTARCAIGERLVQGTGRLIEGIAADDSPQRVEALLAELNKPLSAALEVLDRSAVLGALENLRERPEWKRLSGLELLSLSERICEMYLRRLRDHQIAVCGGDELYENFCARADRCRSAEELFRFLSETIGVSMDRIIESRKQADAKPIRLAKQYIRQHYMEPVSLEEVSGVAGFSPSYFSTLFKKESGSSFVDYLCEIRMNRAKELLRETNLNISAVCEQVGYSDLKYFTKNFKRCTGIKPNEYRKLYS